MMGHREGKLGDEIDVFHRGWRRMLKWTRGRSHAVKTSFSRRIRRSARQKMLRLAEGES